MGMYDQEANFEDTFSEGDRMVITGMQYTGEINTVHGKARRTLITVVTRDSYPARKTFSALGVGFANMAQRAERTDFPHVAEYVTVPLEGDKRVKRFAKVDVEPRAWVDGEDGPPVDLAAFAPNTNTTNGSEDDIPF